MIAFIVPLNGITQVITYRKLSINSPEKLKQIGFKILQSLNLVTTVPAAGVMFISRKNGVLSIKPVVWVRDIGTLFYETACASGTTAIGLVEFLKKREVSDTSQLAKDFTIIQPSGQELICRMSLGNGKLTAEIGGPVSILNFLIRDRACEI